MNITYARIRQRARQIVDRYPSPDFYQDYSFADELSRQYLETNPSTEKLQSFVAEHLEDNLGHGLEHALKVAIDAGTLMIIESRLLCRSEKVIKRRVVMVQCAGLLHDIQRKHENHAVKGAAFAKQVLKVFPFKSDEVEDICRAIRNHEAFKKSENTGTPEGALVSDCLYDADKFRWGPDNFTDTVWAMVSLSNMPIARFVDLYPEGMKKLSEIKNTFRTMTGKKYGPQFIDIGLAVGKELFDVIHKEFADLL
jgi:hypothetical protein